MWIPILRTLRWSVPFAMHLGLVNTTAIASATPQDAPMSPGPESGMKETQFGSAFGRSYFVPNAGQWSDPGVILGLCAPGAAFAFRESSLSILVTRLSNPAESSPASRFAVQGQVSHRRTRTLDESHGGHRIDVTFPGSNAVSPTGVDELPCWFNFQVEGDGRAAVPHVRPFSSVRYTNLYEAVDLDVTGGSGGVLKYTFEVAAGADASAIRIRYDGIDQLTINASGNLEVVTPVGTLRDTAPVVWQERSGQRTYLPARFHLIDETTYTIEVLQTPDPSLPTFIDPEVNWMTYAGGSSDEVGLDVDVAASGNIYVAGWTASSNFTGRNNSFFGGIEDAFVAKIDGSGALQWMTYLGGGDLDEARGVTIHEDDSCTVTGWTRSTNFFGRLNSYFGGSGDSFVARVEANGVLRWMTYVGGRYEDQGLDILDWGDDGSVVTGFTYSDNFVGGTNLPRGFGDAFVATVDGNGSVQNMRYVGGTGSDDGVRLAHDGSGGVVLAGTTSSDDLEEATNDRHGAGSDDAYVMRLTDDLLPNWSAYVGGSSYEFATDTAVDNQGHVVVVGGTTSEDCEGSTNGYHGGFGDGFVARIDPLGTLLWLTYIGGSGTDQCVGVLIEGESNIVSAGYTDSLDVEGRINTPRGLVDSILAKNSPDGDILWVRHIGGKRDDVAEAIAPFSSDSIVMTGRTESSNFEGRNNALKGEFDAFAAVTTGVSQFGIDVTRTGTTVRIRWNGAPPGVAIDVWASTAEGNCTIPGGNACAGTPINLGCPLTVGATIPAGLNAIGSGTATRSYAGPSRFTQAVARAHCVRSNVDIGF